MNKTLQEFLMKKRLSAFLKSCCCTAVVLCISALLASCDDEDDAAFLLNPQDICGIQYSNEQINSDWDGINMEDVTLMFTPVEGDNTKLKLRFGGIMPSWEDMEVVVDVVPGKTDICFSGVAKTSKYELKVEGRYDNPSEYYKKQIIDLKCSYRTIGNLQVETPYIFRFDENCMSCLSGKSFSVEWDGNTYPARQFVESVLEHISARIAKEVTALQVVFHDDASVDISLLRAGESDFTLWMTVKYWYISNNELFLDFTDKQMMMFYEEWVGITAGASPFIPNAARNNSNLLRMIYWSADRLCWSIANPYRYWMLDMYVEVKGIEGLTEKEKQELLLFRDCLYKVDDLNDWNSWCITMNSEFVKGQ